MDLTPEPGRPNETIFQSQWSEPETKVCSDPAWRSDNGVDHAGHHPEPFLSPSLQSCAFSNSIREAGLELMPKTNDPAVSKSSSGQVELGRWREGVKTPIEGCPQHGRPSTAANDNGLAWPLIPFPDGWHGA